MNTGLASLSSEQLRRAVAIKEQIEALEKELNAILSGAAPAVGAEAAAAPTAQRVYRRRGRPPGRAGRAAAVALAATAPAAAAETAAAAPRKRRISPEGRRRIIEAARRRWAAWRAARAQQEKAQQK
ncbi:hypothetical protein G4L39_06370 [Limisphaera ngatamarikiensis]|uniref:Uncharacterized protein n=1 Tax=Limisphaera ngatamarikiensis TaxID=1324935 RepID=A0A6M1S0W5_9BACT|nr:hypothetical protein [Limisphaera ngatamarikiensis]NGO39020.1 hypothetical protein [Limisphaera ngatamarikiensis]